MSVIIRGPGGSSTVIGGSSKGFPPGDVTGITSTVNNQKVLIKWTDPEDVIVGGSTLSTWAGTLIIRNPDHFPTSIKDGDVVVDSKVKNAYKDKYFEDTGLQNNHTYYYRFYPYNSNKEYNDSSNLVFKQKPVSFAPTFADNTWEQIIAASESNNIPSTWKVGDEITIQLSGSFNEPITLQIWDFKHFDKSDGSGKAGICFGMKHLMKNTQQMNSSGTNSGGWNATNMKKIVMNNIYNSIPVEIRNHIKEVKTYANPGDYNTSSSQGLLSKDKVFLPGLTECCNTWSAQNQTETGQKKFPIFSDNNSRIKKLNNGSGSANWWWTRSPYYYYNSAFCLFSTDGDWSRSSADNSGGVCVCFNI